MPDLDRWTIGDVAAYLGVAAGTVRSWKSRGVMPVPDASIDGRTPAWSAGVIGPFLDAYSRSRVASAWKQRRADGS